jgi:predicted MFS family arabinose efflux permease
MLKTAVGFGTGLINLLASVVGERSGYNAGFLMLAAISTVALAVFWLCVPETKSALRPAVVQP